MINDAEQKGLITPGKVTRGVIAVCSCMENEKCVICS